MTAPTPDVREIAARATFEHEWRAPGEPDWDDLTPGEQESYRHLADAVLSAVTPAIEDRAVREQRDAVKGIVFGTSVARSLAYTETPDALVSLTAERIWSNLEGHFAAALARSHVQHREEEK